MKQILLGLLFMVMGGAVMYYSYSIMEMFGRNAWAERNLGWTRNAIVFLWFLFVLVGGLILFGVVGVGNPTETIPDWFGSMQ